MVSFRDWLTPAVRQLAATVIRPSLVERKMGKPTHHRTILDGRVPMQLYERVSILSQRGLTASGLLLGMSCLLSLV